MIAKERTVPHSTPIPTNGYCFCPAAKRDRSNSLAAGRTAKSAANTDILIMKLEILLGEKEIRVWGDGSPTREFLYSEDAARGIVMATQSHNDSEPVNLGTGIEISIRNLVTPPELMEFDGQSSTETKPNGQPCHCLIPNGLSLPLVLSRR